MPAGRKKLSNVVFEEAALEMEVGKEGRVHLKED